MEAPFKARSLDFLRLFVTGIIGGVVVGAFSNAVNALLSPDYFATIIGDVYEIWQTSIFMGVLEGLILGGVLSLAFTIVVAISSRLCCPYTVSVRHLFGILAGVLVFWAAGGLFAICLAFLAPEIYRFAINDLPSNPAGVLGNIWVNGSNLGVEIGGTLCAIVGAAMFPRRWEAYLKAEEAREFQLTK